MIKPIKINVLSQTYCYAVRCDKCKKVNCQICRFKDADFAIPDMKGANDIPDLDCPICRENLK